MPHCLGVTLRNPQQERDAMRVRVRVERRLRAHVGILALREQALRQQKTALPWL